MMDMWTTNYLSPVLEQQQNIEMISGSIEDGLTTLKLVFKIVLSIFSLQITPPPQLPLLSLEMVGISMI